MSWNVHQSMGLRKVRIIALQHLLLGRRRMPCWSCSIQEGSSSPSPFAGTETQRGVATISPSPEQETADVMPVKVSISFLGKSFTALLTQFLSMLCHLAKLSALSSAAAQLMAASWRRCICGGKDPLECLQNFETYNSRRFTQGCSCRLQSLRRQSQRDGVGQLAWQWA